MCVCLCRGVFVIGGVCVCVCVEGYLSLVVGVCRGVFVIGGVCVCVEGWRAMKSCTFPLYELVCQVVVCVSG